MSSFPVLLHNPKVLIIGGGSVASHKTKVLCEHRVALCVVAKTIDERIKALGVTCKEKTFSPADLQGFEYVVDATGSEAVCEQLLQERRKGFFLLNVVSNPQVSDFFFSSLLSRGKLKVAISSEGASPVITQCVRDEIARILPQDLEAFCEQTFHERMLGHIDKTKTKAACSKLLKKVSLVGCGLGDPELLTIKAYRTIQEAEVVLYDHLISKEILALVPSNVEMLFVGKQKGKHYKKQEEINELLLEYAKTGKKIARLKSGDPYIFGRGSEEAEALLAQGYTVEVVNGLSSAIAGPATAGIPVTSRGYATNFSVVSAHLKGHRVNLDWLQLLKVPNHTTVVLMGLSLCEHIQKAALMEGVNEEMPVAIVSNASRPNQEVVTGVLKELFTLSEGMQSPAILIFGDVVKLNAILC